MHEELKDKLMKFHFEKTEYNDLGEDDSHLKIQKKIKQEIYSVSDRLELMEKSMDEQKTIITQQHEMMLS